MNFRLFCLFFVLCFLESFAKQEEESSLSVNLYYETLCPDCQQFSKKQLCPLWEKFGNYFKIEFVPYGNARTNLTPEVSIECQHGPSECAGNRLHSCALKYLPYNQSTKLICCMESAKHFDSAGQTCSRKLGIDYKKLKACGDSEEGNQLHYQNGLKTSKLQPPHQWVPWILFNGHYSKADMEAAEEDLLSVLCKYFPDPKPRECNEIM